MRNPVPIAFALFAISIATDASAYQVNCGSGAFTVGWPGSEFMEARLNGSQTVSNPTLVDRFHAGVDVRRSTSQAPTCAVDHPVRAIFTGIATTTAQGCALGNSECLRIESGDVAFEYVHIDLALTSGPVESGGLIWKRCQLMKS